MQLQLTIAYVHMQPLIASRVWKKFSRQLLWLHRWRNLFHMGHWPWVDGLCGDGLDRGHQQIKQCMIKAVNFCWIFPQHVRDQPFLSMHFYIHVMIHLSLTFFQMSTTFVTCILLMLADVVLTIPWCLKIRMLLSLFIFFWLITKYAVYYAIYQLLLYESYALD